MKRFVCKTSGVTVKAICVALFILVSVAVVDACVICVPYPKTTLADTLIRSDTIVMARERADKPFSLYVVEVLKGAAGMSGFDAFIHSTARRRLKQNADDVAVYGRENAEAGWQYIVYADVEYQKFIRALLKQAASWKQSRNDPRRIDFFVERLNSGHSGISEQAYLEVGRAPYATIKRAAGSVSRKQIHDFLSDWQLVEWHSLYILMLGQSRHPDDTAFIRKHLISSAAYASRLNLSAWVTAFIESHPDTGVEEIENIYFRTSHRTMEELQEVLIGLSVLGAERGSREAVSRRRRIVSSYGTLIENYPMMAGPVAKDLTAWQIRALTEPLTRVKESASELDADAKLAITHYLSVSHRFPQMETAR